MKSAKKIICSDCGKDVVKLGLVIKKGERFIFKCLSCCSIPLCEFLKDALEI